MGVAGPDQVVILVHGTFAADDRDDGTDRWWQRNSPVAQSLAEEVRLLNGAPVRCAPEGVGHFYSPPWWKRLWRRYVSEKCLGESIQSSMDAVFHWSGHNRESARRQAGAMLLDHLKSFDSRGPFHVVAHSHGGGVLWEALSLAAAETPDDQRGGPLQNLRSCTTVATPFLRYSPDFWAVTAVLPLGALALLLWFQMPWFWDVWAQLFPSIGWNPYIKFAAFLVLYSFIILTVSLLMRAAWSWYYYESVIQENAQLVPEVRQHQRDDIVSSLLALAPAVAACVIVAALFGSNLRFGFNARDTIVALLAVLYAISALVLLVLYVRKVTVPLWRSIDNTRRSKNELRAWQIFGARMLFLAAEHTDEAINGLRSLRRRVRGTLLPRMPSPRETELSPGKRLLSRPENEAWQQTLTGWMIRYLLLPLVIVKDWVLAPLYNDVFSKLVDDYVIQQLQKKAIGIDIAGLVLSDVTTVPSSALHEASNSLPAEAEAELVRDANVTLVRVFERVRTQLHLSYPVGPELESFMHRAMQGDPDVESALVHTSYFGCKIVRGAIAKRIAGEPATVMEEAARAEPDGQLFEAPIWAADADEPRISGSRLGFVAWLLRGLIKIIILLAPVLLLAAAGSAVCYPYSRAFHRVWATRTDNAHNIGVTDFVVFTSVAGRPYTTSLSARWWVAMHSVDSELDDGLLGNTFPTAASRTAFYAAVGQKFAQLGDRCGALRAFCLAAREIEIARNSARDWQRPAQKLSGGLYMAKMYLSAADYASLAKEMFIHCTHVDEIRQLVDEEMGSLAADRRVTDEFSRLQEWKKSPPQTSTEVLVWASQSRRRFGTAERLAFLACVGPVLSSVVQNDLSAAMLRTVNENLKEKEYKPEERLRLLKYAVAVACVSTAQYQDQLLNRARLLQKAIEADSNPRSTRYAVLAKAMLGKFRGGQSAAERVADLASALQGATSQELRDQEIGLRGQLATCLACVQRIRDARLIAEGYGDHAQMEAALGIWENELILREPKNPDLLRRVFRLHVALDEDFWGPEDTTMALPVQ
jgi:hypothetical protein